MEVTSYDDFVLWVWIRCTFLYSETPTAQKVTHETDMKSNILRGAVSQKDQTLELSILDKFVNKLMALKK